MLWSICKPWNVLFFIEKKNLNRSYRAFVLNFNTNITLILSNPFFLLSYSTVNLNVLCITVFSYLLIFTFCLVIPSIYSTIHAFQTSGQNLLHPKINLYSLKTSWFVLRVSHEKYPNFSCKCFFLLSIPNLYFTIKYVKNCILIF